MQDTLRDRSHRKRDGDQDHVKPRRARRVVRVPGVAEEADGEDEDADGDGAVADGHAELLQRGLERRLVRGRVRDAPALVLLIVHEHRRDGT